MPNINNELTQLLDPHKNDLYGVVGLTETVIKVSNRPGFIWVRLLDNLSEAIQVYNRKVNPTYNLPVKLTFDGTKYEIDSVDANRYSQWNSIQAYLPEHGMQHSAMYGASGNDIVWVDQRQFLPLLPTPTGFTGTNVITVAPYVFRNTQGNWIYAGNTGVICPPSSMATGSTIQLLSLRDSDGALYFKPGTPFVGQISGANAFVPHLPTLDNNNDIPLAGILRIGNVSGTRILWDSVLDVRQFYTGHVSAPTGSGYLESMRVSISGTLIGNAKEIDFYGNFSGTLVGNTVKIYDKASAPTLSASGWADAPGTWSYSSASAPNFVVSINTDVTNILGLGMRIKLTQGTIKYFIVVNIGVYSGGVTLVTLYGGTNYTLVNSAISNIFYSPMKLPQGFPYNPALWSVLTSDNVQRSISNPTGTVWYNLGNISTTIPLGLWDISYSLIVNIGGIPYSLGSIASIFSTLSTSNNTESDSSWTRKTNASPVVSVANSMYARQTILASGTLTYYILSKTNGMSGTVLYNENDQQTLKIQSVCGYL